MRNRIVLRKFYIGLVLILTLFAATSVFAAQEQAPQTSGPDNDAMAALMRMADFLSQARQYSVTIGAGYDVVQQSGQKIEFGEVRKVTLSRPNHIRVDVERSDGEKGLVVFDGKDIIVFSPKDQVFAKTSNPGDLDGAIMFLLQDLKIRVPLAMMFVTRLPEELRNRVLSAVMVEQSVMMDVPCMHVAARTKDVDFQVWIPSAGDPLPRRIVITYKLEKGQPQFWANFSEWNLTPNISESLFAFTPPEGVEQIPFLAHIQEKKPDARKVKKGGAR